MLLVPTASLNKLMGDIVATVHTLPDHHGNRIVHATLDPAALRSAVLIALTIATGDTLMPADTKIIKHRDERLPFIQEI